MVFYTYQTIMNQNLCWYAHLLTSQLVCCVFFPHQLSKPFVLAVKCQNHQCAELLITRYRGMVSTYMLSIVYTVISLKRSHRQSTLQVCQRMGWVLFQVHVSICNHERAPMSCFQRLSRPSNINSKVHQNGGGFEVKS